MFYRVIKDEEEIVKPIDYLGRMYFDLLGNTVNIPAFLYDETFSRVKRLLEQMTDSEREYMKLYYGAGEDRMLTFGELGERLGISEEEARDIFLSIKYAKLEGAVRIYHMKYGIEKPPVYLGTEIYQNMDLRRLLIEEIKNRLCKREEETVFLDSVLKRNQMEIEPAEDCFMADTEIGLLDLSVRSYNCLKRARIKTVGDLREFSEDTLMRVRNMGRSSMLEIIEAKEECSRKTYATLRIHRGEQTAEHHFHGDEGEAAAALYWCMTESRPGRKTVIQKGMFPRLTAFLLGQGYMFMEDAVKDKEDLENKLSDDGELKLLKEFNYHCKTERYEQRIREEGMITLCYTPFVDC